MKTVLSLLLLAALLDGHIGIMAQPGRMTQPRRLFHKPAQGYVPDAGTAIQIAVAVWTPIYGKQMIQNERPYQETLRKGVWTVTGSMPKASVGIAFGGVALAKIAKSDGRILDIIHGE